MSGICALYRFDAAPLSRRRLARVLDALDGWGGAASSWPPEAEHGPVALGCRTQAITPEDRFDRQPLVSADGAHVLVADARIDNREELATGLRLAARETDTMPDSEFILRAYQAWGEDCPRRLIGDFAFVLWDARRRTLFAARDGMGQRVLFYHKSSQWLSIASSPGALVALDHVPAALNEQKVADFLVLLQNPETTFFRDIDRLPPGHALVADERGIRLKRYWWPGAAGDIRFASDKEYLEGFHSVFSRAVQARLRAAGPVAIMLSGGLDSSTVAASAARHLRPSGARLHAFHAAPRRGFSGAVRNGWIADESDDVRAIAQLHDNIDLEIQRPGERSPLDELDGLFRATGMPLRNVSNRAWLDSIYLTMHHRGMRVLLSGQKGNATISYTGLRSLREMARSGHWVHVLREVRAVARRTNQRPVTVLKDQILLALAPVWMIRAWSRVRGRKSEETWTKRYSAIRPDFAVAMRVEERIHAAREDDLARDRAGGLEYRQSVLTAGDALDYTHGLRSWVGVETRDPTSDTRVVDYCLGLPGPQYLRDGRNRLLVRRAMRGLLPDSLLDRDTRGAQAADWVEWLPAMRQQVEQNLDRLEQSKAVRRCLDLEQMRLLVNQWPERFGIEHTADYNLRLLRGIMAGRFITWFEDTYG